MGGEASFVMLATPGKGRRRRNEEEEGDTVSDTDRRKEDIPRTGRHGGTSSRECRSQRPILRGSPDPEGEYIPKPDSPIETAVRNYIRSRRSWGKTIGDRIRNGKTSMRGKQATPKEKQNTEPTNPIILFTRPHQKPRRRGRKSRRTTQRKPAGTDRKGKGKGASPSLTDQIPHSKHNIPRKSAAARPSNCSSNHPRQKQKLQ